MRIISGEAKGRKLIAPDGTRTRPTADKIKEAIFSIMAPDLQGCVFLDLFCGSGGMGIEALSRGAEHCAFVDNSRQAVDCTIYNLKTSKLYASAEIIKKDALSALKLLSERKARFDIIFMDPPYKADIINPVLNAVCKGKLLNEEGIIVIEHSLEYAVSQDLGFISFKVKKYSKTLINFMEWQ